MLIISKKREKGRSGKGLCDSRTTNRYILLSRFAGSWLLFVQVLYVYYNRMQWGRDVICAFFFLSFPPTLSVKRQVGKKRGVEDS